jgi:hypothetical protein
MMQTQAAGSELLAVIYAFEVYQDGERRLVAQDGAPASTAGYLQAQLGGVPKRTLVDSGPGLLVYNNYQSARQAAQTIVRLVARVELREVVAGASADGAGDWTSVTGRRYTAKPGGLTEIVKGE